MLRVVFRCDMTCMIGLNIHIFVFFDELIKYSKYLLNLERAQRVSGAFDAIQVTVDEYIKVRRNFFKLESDWLDFEWDTHALYF